LSSVARRTRSSLELKMVSVALAEAKVIATSTATQGGHEHAVATDRLAGEEDGAGQRAHRYA
jgi:hypothetical protein